MSKIAQCPECGGEVRFEQPGALLSVCTFCRSVVARRDVDVASLGKLGMLADVPSPLQRHLRGRAFGGFIVAGRLQLDHGAGTWNEWQLALDDGRWLWLAEVQGHYYLTAPVPLAAGAAPAFAQARPGHSVRLPIPPDPALQRTCADVGMAAAAQSGAATLRVAEVHTAKLIAAEGELPATLRPGQPVRYLDLSGPRGTFGTLDYGPPDAGPKDVALYLGSEVALSALQLDYPGSGLPPPAGPRVKAARMECPQCHGALDLRAPDAALRVVCPYCHTLSAVGEGKLAPLKTLKKASPPPIALGQKGTLRGTAYQVIGYSQRRIKSSGFVFDEYVLAAGDGGTLGFHYLLEAGGHYTLVRPANLGDVLGKGKTRVYQDQEFTLCERSLTQVAHIDGEFPWAVELGEEVLAEDFARPGQLLSVETSRGERAEINVSLGDYVEPEEVKAALGAPVLPRTYVAPHQPNPYSAALARQKPLFWRSLAVLIALMVGALVLNGSRGGRRTFALDTIAGVEPAAEHVFLSEPFDLGKRNFLLGHAAAQVVLKADIDGSWLDADVALINDDTGAVQPLSLGISYYHGVDDGESWSEGSREAIVTVPMLPAGRYVLRVEPSWPVQRPCDTSSDCGSLDTWSCSQSHCQRTCDASQACPRGTTCDEQQHACVLPALHYTVEVSYGTPRIVYGFLVLLLLGVVPVYTASRRNSFEQRRREDQDPIEG